MDWGVTDLTCRRGARDVLTGVTFRVGAGRAVRLTGPNGSGKTTLLRTLAGLAPPPRGTVDAPPDAFAFAGHADGLKGQLTVGENLRFWAGVFGADPGTVEEALDAFALRPLAGRRAADLSAGQTRRAGLARLLVTGRPVWLLDEPTVSLDAASVEAFGTRVARHLAGGGSALIATHVALGLPGTQALDVAAFAQAVGASVADAAFADAIE
ncbi:heme ABC exporter ATP-binding protein CcmA [Jannaschia sp. LMIT008]|uniref:heme ABC exporter ATP-binding protein CcmA n=1 Tax=Jannaschia maritima TaxID=3032585 RepID=UPI002811A4C5|nr:heme ABC exporter ATP-binding protein CcmA [Jannaschia sp. LMIT008]